MIIELKDSQTKVEIIDKDLSWGQKEEIQEAMLSGVSIKKSDLSKETKEDDVKLDASALSRAKYATFKVCIKKITDVNGEEIPYSKEWIYELSQKDGNALFNAVNRVSNTDNGKKN